MNCAALPEVALPPSLKYMASRAFLDCPNVKVSCVKAREAIRSMRPFFRQWAQSPLRQGP